MRIILLAFLWLGLALPAANGRDISIEQISAAGHGDINQDGVDDLALLIAPHADDTQDHALAVFFGEAFEGTLTPVLVIDDFVWGSVGEKLVGQRASLAIDQRGSLRVTSHNSAIGRNRWEQTLTLAWRDDRLLLAGFTYDFYDTLDPDANGGCDLNVLTGRGVKTRGGVETRFSIAGRMIGAEEFARDLDGYDLCGLF